MSSATRAVNSPSAAPVSGGGRAGGIVRMMGAPFSAPISDIDAQAGVQGGNQSLTFRDYSKYMPQDGGSYRPPSDRPRMNFGSSRDFASAFEAQLEDGAFLDANEGEEVIAELPTRMARASHTYERNAAAVFNAPKTRGTALSMTL